MNEWPTESVRPGERRPYFATIPGGAVFSRARAWFSAQYLVAVPETRPVLRFIGPERKTHFPRCARSFDPGVRSRSDWAVSTRDVELAVQSEQRLNRFEWLTQKLWLKHQRVPSRSFGDSALHDREGIMLPIGPLEAIASFSSSEGLGLAVGP